MMPRLTLLILLVQAAATITDLRNGRVYHIFTDIGMAAGLVAFTFMSQQTGSPVFIVGAITFTALFYLFGRHLEHRGTWKHGDTRLFTCAGTTLWPLAIPWLITFIPVSIIYVITWKDAYNTPIKFAPVFLLTTLSITPLIF